jgi:excisionase family DNA binding protein
VSKIYKKKIKPPHLSSTRKRGGIKKGRPRQKAGRLAADQIIGSQREAARYAGVTERTIRRWASEKGMPQTQDGRYIRSFLDVYKANEGHQPTDDLRRIDAAEADYKEIKAKLAKFELDVKQGKLISLEDETEERIKRITAVKRQLLGLPRKLAPRLEGKNEAERLEMIKTEIEYCIRIFSGESLAAEVTEGTEKDE